MMTKIFEIYRRILTFLRLLPLLAALPFAVEPLQHAVEISLGLYQAGTLTPEGRQVRLAFGLIKLAGIVVVIIAGLRLWRFEGDRRRALRPSWTMAAGILIFVPLELADSLIEVGIQGLAAAAIDLRAGAVAERHAVAFAPTFVWTFLSGLWLPWNVGLLVDDRTMTPRRSMAAAAGRLWLFFGLICAGVIPLMSLHYVLGSVSVGQPMITVWALNILDAAVVVLLTLSIGSSFYAVYAAAKGGSGSRSGRSGSGSPAAPHAGRRRKKRVL